MNIMFRTIDELVINLMNKEDRVLFYQNNIYDNIYMLSEQNKYCGYLNFELEKESLPPNTLIYISDTASLNDVSDYFINHPGKYRVPVVNRKFELIGEYFDNNTIGKSLYKKIEDRCLELVPFFSEYINSFIKGKRISVLGTNNNINYLKKYIKNIESYEESKDSQIIIDTIYSEPFRKLIRKDYFSYTSLSNIFIPALIIALKKYFDEHNIKFYVANGVRKRNIKDQLSPKEKENINKSIEEVINEDEYIKKLYIDDKESYSFVSAHKNDINQISRIVSNGIHNILLDRNETGFNIINGQRITTNTPKKNNLSIHIYGPCVVQGLCVIDSKTIPSIIQESINQSGEKKVEVINHGLAYGKDLLNDLLYMISQKYKENDIIIWLNGYTEKELEFLKNIDLNIIDCVSDFYGLHDWFYNNPFHCTYKANQIFAKNIYNAIKSDLTYSTNLAETSFIEAENINLKYDADNIVNSYEMSQYLKYLSKYKLKNQKYSNIGSIIMNANPCTNGHIFLIREALKQVDFLYVFLVEDSKNIFSYLDREYMLKNNLKDINNICVLSGGYVMTSEACFPEYFNRNKEYEHINPALHLKVFSQKVAPTLGINYRFFGEEPNDYITNELNKAAVRELAQSNISVIIVPRQKDLEGQYISAKVVRKLFAEKKYKDLVELVPFYTYKRLLEINRDLNKKNLALHKDFMTFME